MKSDYKTACILIDENDLGDFKNSYQHAIPKGSLWVSLDSFSTMQVIFQEFDKSYYIPKVIDNGELATPKGIYQESQKFLKQLLLDNKIIDEAEDSFPLEYFWFCFWTKVYRTILFCNDLLSQFSIKEVILIKRNYCPFDSLIVGCNLIQNMVLWKELTLEVVVWGKVYQQVLGKLLH